MSNTIGEKVLTMLTITELEDLSNKLSHYGSDDWDIAIRNIHYYATPQQVAAALQLLADMLKVQKRIAGIEE